MKSNFLLKCATLILGLSVFAFANSVAFQLVQSVLSQANGFVLFVLGSVIAIYLIPLSWFHVKNVLNRGSHSGSFSSSNKSRIDAVERLKKSKNKSSRYIGFADSTNSSKFRKKYKSFDDFRGSREFRNSDEFKNPRASFRKKGFSEDSGSNKKFEFKFVE